MMMMPAMRMIETSVDEAAVTAAAMDEVMRPVYSRIRAAIV